MEEELRLVGVAVEFIKVVFVVFADVDGAVTVLLDLGMQGETAEM